MTHALPLRRIVVGVDGSAAPAAAVRWAAREARLRYATVHPVCAYHGDARLRAPYASSSWTARLHQRHAAARVALDLATDAARRRLPAGPADRRVGRRTARPGHRGRAGGPGTTPGTRCWQRATVITVSRCRLRETIPAMETDEARPRQGPHPPQATGVFLI